MSKNQTICLVGTDVDKGFADKLTELGFKVLTLPRCVGLAVAISSHPDTLLFTHGKYIFCSEAYCNIPDVQNIFNQLNAYGYKLIPCKSILGDKYPFDIAFNVFTANKGIYGRLAYTEKEILTYTDKLDIKQINVKQGYAKCSTLVLGDKGIVTADNGIAAAAVQEGLQVLKISNSPNAVSLAGYDYGFIGGACGVYKNKVYFTGNIDLHPDGDNINKFCNRLGFEVHSLCDRRLCDVGGIMFFEDISKN